MDGGNARRQQQRDKRKVVDQHQNHKKDVKTGGFGVSFDDCLMGVGGLNGEAKSREEYFQLQIGAFSQQKVH